MKVELFSLITIGKIVVTAVAVGGLEKRGKYATSAFTSEYHAISFSNIVQRRLGDDVQVYIGKNPLRY